MCTAHHFTFTCGHSQHTTTTFCTPLSFMPNTATNCLLNPHYTPQPTKCPSCLASDRYLAPRNLNTSERYYNAVVRRAETNPWQLEEGHYWVLDSVSMLGAIGILEERSAWRRSQGQERSVEEACAVAKCKYHIGRLAEESDAQLIEALEMVEKLCRDARVRMQQVEQLQQQQEGGNGTEGGDGSGQDGSG